MCGIAGWLGNNSLGEQYAHRMAERLEHRGPDSFGIQSWPHATLVHTRLSIIDLSKFGDQPMANETGDVWVVCNGEIYNHRELRRGLEKRGHRFAGNSDSEVIPHLYEEEGADFVKRLKGMFAFALYDSRNHILLLGRDRFGIKPLFFAVSKNRIAFASELNALLELPGINRKPDRQAIFDYAALFYIPAPATFYTGIKALQPGEIIESRLYPHEVNCKSWFYHQWELQPNHALSLGEATEIADDLINVAVKRQLESDVPLGSLLSGGIDSSLVSAAAQRSMASQLQTFNVRMSDKDFDETWAAVAVAEHIGSQHETLSMKDIQGTWERITDLLLHVGQPYADTSLFAANAVCHLMRRQVTVALSGDGGDEGFGGYPLYWQIARIARMQALPSVLWKVGNQVLGPLGKLGLVHPRVAARFQDLTGADDTDIVQSMYCILREEELGNLCRYRDELPSRRLFESKWKNRFPPNATRLERLSAHATEANIRLMLPNDFLFKVDMASMKEGLEVRVPMLDEDVFNFSLSLPHHLKVAGRTCKKVLREVSQKRLPRAVANKPKLGFAIPVDHWVDKNFKPQLKKTLLGPSSLLPEMFNPKEYQPKVEAFCDGRQYPGMSRKALYNFAIMLLSVNLYLERASV